MDGFHDGRFAFSGKQVVHRRNHDGDGDRVFDDRIYDFRRALKTQDDDRGMMVQAGVHDSGEAVAVEHRQDAEDLVFRHEDDLFGELFHVGNKVLVRQHGTLRASGRAGGVDEGANVVFCQIRREWRCFFERAVLGFVVVIMQVDDAAGNGQRHIGDDELGTGVLQDEIDFAVDKGIVDRDDDGSQGNDCHVCIDETRAVGAVEADSVAFPDTFSVKQISESSDGFGQLAICDFYVAVKGYMGGIRSVDHFMYKHPGHLSEITFRKAESAVFAAFAPAASSLPGKVSFLV